MPFWRVAADDVARQPDAADDRGRRTLDADAVLEIRQRRGRQGVHADPVRVDLVRCRRRAQDGDAVLPLPEMTLPASGVPTVLPDELLITTP